MAHIIAALFRTQREGEAAHNKLLASGFTRDEVSFIAGHPNHALTPRETTLLTDALGVAIEAMALLVPGTGPLVAAGPLGGAIAQTGSEQAAVSHVLLDHGVSEEQAEFYLDGVRSGGSLVAIHNASGDAESKALAILADCGALKSEELAS